MPQLRGNYDVCVVEYKNGKPDADGSPKHADAIQVAAQMLCLSAMLGQAVLDGCVFYNTTKRRVRIENVAALSGEVEEMVRDMREIAMSKQIPPKAPGQNCNHCSMREVCLPDTQAARSQRRRIQSSWRREYEETT